MPTLPQRSFRLYGRPDNVLDAITGEPGEFFLDTTANSLRVYNGDTFGGELMANRTWVIENLTSTLTPYATLTYTNGQLSLKAPINNPIFTGTVQADKFIGTGIGAYLSDTPPVAPIVQTGMIWFNTNTGKLYIYYNDGNSTQWVQPMTPSVGGGSGGGGTGSGTVSSGSSGRLAYYATSGTTVDDLANVYWHTHDGVSMLHINGSIEVSGQKNLIRFHWDTLADLTNEVNPSIWHGMLAHVHDTGRVYFAHAGAWIPLANQSDVSTGYSTLAALTDVNVSGVTDGQVLKYSSTQNKWIPAADLQTSGGGGVALNSFSVSTTAPSGAGSLSYNNLTGVFTFTPAALGIISVANGGTGTATPSLVAGSNISVTGTWPNQTIAATTNSFSTIAVAGQSNVAADSSTDTLTLVAGSNITITTNATTDTITISSTSGSTTLASLTDVNVTGVTDGQVLKYSTSQSKWIAASDLTATGGSGISLSDLSVSVAAASGGGNLLYDNITGVFTFTPAVTGVTSVSGTGTVNGITLSGTVTSTGNLTLGGTLSNVSLSSQVTGILPVANGGTGTSTPGLVQGTNITISGTWPNQTISSTGSGVSTFAALTDVAGLTIDQIYLPAITRLNTTANGSSSYSFDQYASTNPTIYAINGTTIAFNLNVSGHPFLIQTSGGVNYNTGLIHVSTTGVVTSGASAQGQTSGTLYWKIPTSISGNYRYICSIHGGMTGTITIKDIATI